MKPDFARRMPIAIAAAVLLVALHGCDRSAPAGAERDIGEGAAAAPLRVVVQRPSRPDPTQRMTLPGTVEAWETARLFARVTGYIEEVEVEIGADVHAGDELARLTVPEMAAELRGAEARIAHERAELELARLTRKRLGALHGANADAIPQQDVDVAGAKEKIEVAQVEMAQADFERLQALARYSHLTAPFDGRITRRWLHPGGLAKEGTSSGAVPIVEIARTDRLRLVFDVPEMLDPRVRVGMPLQVRFDAFPNVGMEAVLARVAGALDPKTRSMRAEADLDNPDDRLRPGMYAAVELEIEVTRGALSIPSRSLRGSHGDRYVLIADNGLLHRRPVVVAADDGRRALVVDGLKADDRVVIAGSPLARDGVACDAVEEEA